MKKKFAGRLGLTALALTFITTSVMSGTLAKYTMNVEASAEATVAKFEFKLNTITATESMELTDLFTNTANTNVKSGTLAPNTKNSYPIKIENTGDVTIQLDKITMKNDNTASDNVPIQYALTNSSAAPTDSDSAWKTVDSTTGTDLTLSTDKTIPFKTSDSDTNTINNKTLYLHWRWKTDTDTADTALGQSPVTIKPTITITVSQVI